MTTTYQGSEYECPKCHARRWLTITERGNLVSFNMPYCLAMGCGETMVLVAEVREEDAALYGGQK
jgi:hypothetical protein